VRRALPFLIVLLLAGAVRAEEEAPPEARVSIGRSTLKETRYIGEAFDVWLEVGYDAEFLEKSGVPLFQRDMDLPLHVRAPWLRELRGAQRLISADVDGGHGLRFALNDEIVAQVPE